MKEYKVYKGVENGKLVVETRTEKLRIKTKPARRQPSSISDEEWKSMMEHEELVDRMHEAELEGLSYWEDDRKRECNDIDW